MNDVTDYEIIAPTQYHAVEITKAWHRYVMLPAFYFAIIVAGLFFLAIPFLRNIPKEFSQIAYLALIVFTLIFSRYLSATALRKVLNHPFDSFRILLVQPKNDSNH